MAHGFDKLPTEVVQLIVSFLEPNNILLIRDVSRNLYRQTLEKFCSSFFATVRTNLSPASLQTLREISKSEILAKEVQRLNLSHGGNGFGKGYQWHRNASGQLVAPYEAVETLTDIVVNDLVNCRSFRVDTYDEYFIDNIPSFIMPGDAVGIVLAMIASSSLAIQQLSIQSRHVDRTTAGRLKTARLGTAVCSQPGFVAGWLNLKELVLKNVITYNQQDFMFDLIRHAPELQILCLVFDEDENITASSLLQRLTSAESCPSLQDFSLHSANIDVGVVCDFLGSRAATLRSLEFQSVEIKEGDTWRSVLSILSAKLPRLQSCKMSLLREMKGNAEYVRFDKLTDLPTVPGSEVFMDSRLKHDSRSMLGSSNHVHLTYSNYCEALHALSVRYTGPAMTTFLLLLADAVEPMVRLSPSRNDQTANS